MVSEDFFIFIFMSYGSKWPPGVVAANLNPRGMVGRIYVVNHNALLHTQYRSCRLHGFREDFFLKLRKVYWPCGYRKYFFLNFPL